MQITATATIETVVGKRTVRCDDVWISAPTEAADTDDSGSLRCRLPSIVETAPKLRATLHVESPLIKNATVVPDVMLGQDSSGYVVTLLEQGEKRTVPVDVGPSDGVVRVITSDLPIGATLLDPAK